MNARANSRNLIDHWTPVRLLRRCLHTLIDNYSFEYADGSLASPPRGVDAALGSEQTFFVRYLLHKSILGGNVPRRAVARFAIRASDLGSLLATSRLLDTGHSFHVAF